jgi:OFA family oxalate/formate antiporter-like MFS transporter
MTQPAAPGWNRWLQLTIGVICMVQIANLQYGWTLFVNPIDEKYHWGRPAIQVAFTIFVLLETWLVPVEGWFVDRFGPRIVVVGAGVLVGLSWVMNSVASSLPMLYASAAVAGIGAGAVYGTCVGNALKWFPDKRGLAAGLTAAGFGAGSALTVLPIANMIQSTGYEAAFFRFGILQGAIVFVLGFFLLAPPESHAPKAAAGTASAAAVNDRAYTPLEMAKTPVFWIMYVMFVMMATGGLIATAQASPMAKDFEIAGIPVSLMGITLPALTFALSLDRIFNGISRPFFGWVSDHLGRENTMFVAFMIEGVAVLALGKYGANPTAFVLLMCLVYFAWGEIYSLFPATCGDTYGKKFASANYGLLYTAKGTAALLVPFSSVLAARGGWNMVFVVSSVLNFAAAFMALAVLKPMRSRLRGGAAVPGPALAAPRT